MKAYIRNIEYPYEYPEDMKLILDYLNAHGKILVTNRIIEILYREFSYDMYCAGWMSVDEDILEEFAEWLEDYEV